MFKKIIKASKLHKNDLRAIRNLVDISATYDKHKIKLYNNIIQNRKTSEFNDFLFYIDGNLTGYLALFVFKLDEAEISAIVHPKYREQGIFKKLLFEAYSELNRRGIKHTIVITPQTSNRLEKYLNERNARHKISEFEMTLKNPPEEKKVPDVHLVLAKPEDITLMARIGSESFGSNFLDVLQRFTDNIKDKNRKAWLVKVDDKIVGKIHVRYEPNKTALIHDLCIIPEDRGKYYANGMVRKTLDILQAEGYKRIALDVEAANRGALRLYEQCGFVVTTAFDYYEILTEKLL